MCDPKPGLGLRLLAFFLANQLWFPFLEFKIQNSKGIKFERPRNVLIRRFRRPAPSHSWKEGWYQTLLPFYVFLVVSVFSSRFCGFWFCCALGVRRRKKKIVPIWYFLLAQMPLTYNESSKRQQNKVNSARKHLPAETVETWWAREVSKWGPRRFETFTALPSLVCYITLLQVWVA
jgi:hypothetical protein